MIINFNIRKGKKIYNSILMFFIILSVAILFRSFNLTREFSGDEVILAGISSLEFHQILPYLKQNDAYPPLTYLILHQWMRISHSAVWVRLYFVIYGIAACVVIYYIAKELLGIYIARISFFLASISPLLIYDSQYVRSYMDCAFWMLLSCLFMLRIIKGRSTLTNWMGYIISSILSIYTSYFSLTLITSQFIFISIFLWKEKRIMLKWYVSGSIIFLSLLPCVPLAFFQISHTTPLNFNWSNLGVRLLGLHIGLYARNLFSLIGFDPGFMVYRGGILAKFTTPVIAVIICISFIVFILLLFFYLNYLKKELSEDRALKWFPIFLSFGPVVLCWVCGKLIEVPLPHARYLAVPHGFFLLIMAVFIFILWERKPLLSIFFFIFVFGVFIIRIPYSVSPDIETKKPLSFLKDHFEPQDCLICVNTCPPEGEFLNTIQVGKNMALNKEGSRYIIVSQDSWNELSQRIATYKKIWFYRFYGNVEIFGANHIVDDWLKNMGYKQKNVNTFNNINIVEYEK